MFLEPTRTKVYDSLAKSSGASSHLSRLRFEGVVPSKTTFSSGMGQMQFEHESYIPAKYRNSQLHVSYLALSPLYISVCDQYGEVKLST